MRRPPAGRAETAPARQRGLTLIELLVTLLVLSLVASMAAPYMADYWQRNRTVSAAEAVYSRLQLARSAALARNQDIFIKFGNTGGTGWCMALSEDSSCDCTTGSNCTLTNMPQALLSGSQFVNIALSTDFTGNATTVEVPRGTVTASGSVTLTSQGTADVVQVSLSSLGRVRICSNDLNQYNGC